MGSAIVTEDDFGGRKLALVRAIELAEAELHSVTFKKTTGSATADDVKAAKTHLQKLRDDLDELEAAWAGGIAAWHADRRNQATTDFDAYKASVEALLATRREAMAQVEAALLQVRAGLLAYRDATQEIRQSAAPFHGNAGAASLNCQWALNTALEFPNADKLVAALCGELNVYMAGDWRGAFHGATGEEFEQRTANNIRAALEGFAPKFEDAA